MSTISSAQVIDLCGRLADAIGGYLSLLERGISDEQIDALVHPLLSLQVNALEIGAASLAHQHIAALDHAVATCEREVSVEVTRTRQVSSTGEAGYFPALSGGADTWVAWLDFDPVDCDQLRLRRVAESTDGRGQEVLSGSLDASARVIVRPSFAAGNPAHGSWLLHSVPTSVGWEVRANGLSEAGLGETEVVSDGADHALNQEGVIDPIGQVHVVHQERHGSDFRIAYRSRGVAGWSAATYLSAEGQSAWDPCVAVDDDGLVAVWSCYRDGRFQLVLRRLSGLTWGDEVTVPTNGERHALHPQSASQPGGGIWLTWDSLAFPDQATSGLTRFQSASEVHGDRTHDPIPAFHLDCQIGVAHVVGDSFFEPRSPQPLAVRSAACYPRITVDAGGVLWLAYRAMRQLPFGDYLAHVAVRFHEGDRWSPERLLPASDGTCAEFGLAPDDDGVQVAYHADDHAARHIAMVRGHLVAAEGTEEAQRREHLRMPATDRMAAGGHVGGGPISLATVRAPGVTRLPELVTIRVPASAALARPPQPRDHRPSGWPPDDGVERTLYWGDLHRHSNVSRCGAGLDIGAEDHYRFAEDLLGCDFWALTDHAENSSDLNWHHLKKLANAFYRPGAHASMIGFEWTSFIHGHLNVIYAGDDGPVLSSIDPASDDPAKLWQGLEDHEALTIPHHPAAWVYPTNWSFHSDRFLRLVEVFQACTGSYESDWSHRQYQDALAPGATVQDALKAGHRLGFIGSTDHGNGVAYVGAYAERLDRASIYEALNARRCFAATRRGIVPELRIGSATQGQEAAYDDVRDDAVAFGGEGIAELSIVELVRDGEVVATSRPPSSGDRHTLPLDLQFQSFEGGPRELTGSLTVGGTARLVPTDFYAPEVTSASDKCLTWSLALPAWYGKRAAPPGVFNVGVSVEGAPEDTVLIECAGVSARFTLAELRDGGPAVVAAEGIELRCRLGLGGLTGLGTRRWLGTAPSGIVQAGSWYYVRVIQVDGEAAWSSPIWVDSRVY